MVTSSSGTGDGIRYACGARQKKRGMLSRDKASAKVLWTPGTWAATAWNLYLASRKNRQRRRCANVGSLALPAEITDNRSIVTVELHDGATPGFTPDCCSQDYRKHLFGCDIPLLEFWVFFPSDLKPAASPQCPTPTLA